MHNNCEWLEGNLGQIKNWTSTEPGMQGTKALKEVTEKLAKNDPFVFGQPIKVVEGKGQTFILNGHHRIKAAIEAGYKGVIPYMKVPASDVHLHSGFSNIEEIIYLFGK